MDSVKLFLKFSFAFGIIIYMIVSGRLDLEVVKKGFSHTEYLLPSLFLVILATFLSIYRWGLLLRAQGIQFKLPKLIRYGMIGAFFNTTMPGAVSGDLIKAWYVLNDFKGQKKTPILTSILLDRVMGVFGLILISASPLIWQYDQVWSVPKLRQIGVIVLLLSLGVFLFFTYMMMATWGPFSYVRKRLEFLEQNKLGHTLLKAYDAWISYRNEPLTFIWALILSMCTHLCVVSIVVMSGWSLGEDHIALYQYFLLAPIGLLSTAIPIAPAGLGVGHAAFKGLFDLAGSNRGAEIFTMLVTIQIAVNLSGVFFYLRSPSVKIPEDASVME